MEITLDQRYLIVLPGFFTVTEAIVKEISSSKQYVLLQYIDKDNKHKRWFKYEELKFVEMLQNIADD